MRVGNFKGWRAREEKRGTGVLRRQKGNSFDNRNLQRVNGGLTTTPPFYFLLFNLRLLAVSSTASFAHGIFGEGERAGDWVAVSGPGLIGWWMIGWGDRDR